MKRFENGYEMKKDNTIISSRFAMYVVPTKYILVKGDELCL